LEAERRQKEEEERQRQGQSRGLLRDGDGRKNWTMSLRVVSRRMRRCRNGGAKRSTEGGWKGQAYIYQAFKATGRVSLEDMRAEFPSLKVSHDIKYYQLHAHESRLGIYELRKKELRGVRRILHSSSAK